MAVAKSGGFTNEIGIGFLRNGCIHLAVQDQAHPDHDVEAMRNPLGATKLLRWLASFVWQDQDDVAPPSLPKQFLQESPQQSSLVWGGGGEHTSARDQTRCPKKHCYTRLDSQDRLGSMETLAQPLFNYVSGMFVVSVLEDLAGNFLED